MYSRAMIGAEQVTNPGVPHDQGLVIDCLRYCLAHFRWLASTVFWKLKNSASKAKLVGGVMSE